MANGKPASFLIDTGAGSSIITTKYVKNWGPVNQNEILVGASGTELKVKGIANVHINLGHRHRFTIPMHVMKKFAFDGLLGNEFLNKHVKLIDYGAQTLHLKNGSVTRFRFHTHTPLKLKNIQTTSQLLPSGKSQGLIAVSNQEIILFPHENNWIAINLIDPQSGEIIPPEDHYEYEINDTENFWFPEGKISNNGPPGIHLINTSDKSLLYKRGFKLGFVKCKRPTPIEVPRIREIFAANLPPASLEDIVASDLSSTDRKQLINTLEDFRSLFAREGEPLGQTQIVANRIELQLNSKPVQQSPYRYSFKEREYITEHIKELLESGVIRPSRSPYASAVVLVANGHKGSEKPRFCIDYRNLNAMTIRDTYPIPPCDLILNSLQGMKYFSTIDLQKGYYQISLAEEDIPKTAFVSYDGLFEFTRLPFGLCNAPAIFQRTMDNCLAGLKYVHCLCYLDDVIIFSKTIEEHRIALTKVLGRLQEFGFKLQTKKCEFGKKKVKILGHYVSNEGIEVNPEKIECIKALQPPRTIRDLRAFVGLASYYRKFVPFFSKIAKPLTSLTQLESDLKWGEEQQEAFSKLKELLCSAPILRHFDPKLPSKIHCDSSAYGLGAALVQTENNRDRVVAYASRGLNKAEQNYSTIQREFLALLFALQKFRQYVYGVKFTVVTDHCPLTGLKFAKDASSGKLHRWAVRLSEFDFTVEYKKGKKHSDADGLSRLPRTDDMVEPPEFNIKEPDCPLEFPILHLEKRDMKILQEEDTFCKKLLQPNGLTAKFQILKGILHETSLGTPRLVIPASMRKEILREYHTIPMAAHRGFYGTYGKIRPCYYWPKMKSSIYAFIRNCEGCQTGKRPYRPPQGLLQPMPIPDTPHSFLAIDFAGPLPLTEAGNRYYIIAICMLTRYVTTEATPDQTSATAAKFLLNNIITKFGPPAVMLSDRGKSFMSKSLKTMLSLMGVKQRFTSAYHPQTNGLCERQNSTIKTGLRIYLSRNHQEDWDKYLQQITWAINTTPQATTRMTPFELIFARKPIQPLERSLPTQKERRKTSQIEKYQQIRQDLKQIIEREQQRSKEIYDDKRGTQEYTVGDYVLVYNPATKIHEAPKLKKKWTGPYMVIKKLSSVTYKVQRNDKTQVIHVCRMKPFFLNSSSSDEDPGQSKDSNDLLLNLQSEFSLQDRKNSWPGLFTKIKGDSSPTNLETINQRNPRLCVFTGTNICPNLIRKHAEETCTQHLTISYLDSNSKHHNAKLLNAFKANDHWRKILHEPGLTEYQSKTQKLNIWKISYIKNVLHQSIIIRNSSPEILVCHNLSTNDYTLLACKHLISEIETSPSFSVTELLKTIWTKGFGLETPEQLKSAIHTTIEFYELKNARQETFLHSSSEPSATEREIPTQDPTDKESVANEPLYSEPPPISDAELESETRATSSEEEPPPLPEKRSDRPLTTRVGREVHPPKYLEDYECS